MRTQGMLALAVAAGLGVAAIGWVRKSAEPEAPAFRAVPVERASIEVTALATGVVQPQNRLELKPPIAGRIEKILVREGDRVGRGQVVAWMSSLERAALLDAARAKGAAELAHWEELYKPVPLTAPIAGTIIARNVEPGQSITATDPVFVLSDRLIVKAQVDETDIGRIRLGEQAKVTLDAYANETIDARVDHIAYEAVTVNNVTVYEVDVLPKAVPEFMRAGMTANVTFDVASRENVLVVPAESVEQKDGAATVRVPAGEGRPERKKIELGLTDGDRIEVVAGLDEGASVLVPVLKMPAAADGRGASPLFSFGGRGGRGRGGR
jgi:membrane fusion protein, macrolide-specific efflux system